jgi:uncharacterized protein YacL
MSIEFVLRLIGAVLAAVSAIQVVTNLVDLTPVMPFELWLVYTICSAAFGIGYLVTPYVTTQPFFWVRHHIYHATASEVLAGGIGLSFGLLVGALLAFPLSFLPGYFGRVLPVAASTVLAYFGVMTLLTHKQGILGVLGLSGRGFDRERTDNGRVLLLDSSAVIDGRIADIGPTGFLGGTLVVPRFVLEEIQHIADSPDAMRRHRGRRGLEVLNRLQTESACPVEISDMDVDNAVGVDAKLVALARTLACPIVTNDYNLNHVAQLQGVEVLNVNLLANALRPVLLQGEEVTVRIAQEGKEPGQGVGYLDDGTMVVVDNGRPYLGQEVDLVVVRVLQTAAGRMVFARPKGT